MNSLYGHRLHGPKQIKTYGDTMIWMGILLEPGMPENLRAFVVEGDTERIVGAVYKLEAMTTNGARWQVKAWSGRYRALRYAYSLRDAKKKLSWCVREVLAPRIQVDPDDVSTTSSSGQGFTGRVCFRNPFTGKNKIEVGSMAYTRLVRFGAHFIRYKIPRCYA